MPDIASSLPGDHHEPRLRLLNDAAVRNSGQFVLYWMTGARRTTWNFALERAVAWMKDLQRPLVVLEALRVDYPWASHRHHAFIIRGMAENQRRLAAKGVTSYAYVEPSPGAGRGLLQALASKACVIVTDDAPIFFLGRMVEKSAMKAPVRVEAIDSNGLVPVRLAEKQYLTAASFRRFLHMELPVHLADFPVEDPLRTVPAFKAPNLEKIKKKWPPMPATGMADVDAIIHSLPIDQGVPAIPGQGGPRTGQRRWREFLQERLESYGLSGRRTLDNTSSGLSSYLHYGHISVHQIAREIFRHEEWSPDRIDETSRGRREGWWGLSPAAESFMDQLVTWRELGLNMHANHAKPESYGSLPGWARETLEGHAKDIRPYRYDMKALESAKTHDLLWNAAQRQLLQEGIIHNYLRMLWGKKILEWTSSPRRALQVMLHLNNRHALDGRDPNSTSGIFWTLGRYDRPWFPERPIFGRVRYMSSANTARKMQVRAYMAKYSSGD